MKHKIFHKKISNPLNNKNKKNHRNEKGQMIVLMGIMLAISVFVIASIPSQISDVSVVVSRERSTSILPEFIHIKEVFGKSLNYNLVHESYGGGIAFDIGSGEPVHDHLYTWFFGDIKYIENTFQETRDSFQILELNHNNFFDAQFKNYYYSHTSLFYGDIYNVGVTLTLDNGKTSITEDVEYFIICNMWGEIT